MVQTRSARAPEVPSSFGLIRALLAGNTSRARQLLHQALVSGPSGFSCLHAAALSDCHRLIAPLVAARLQANEANAEAPIPAAMAGPDQQIGPLDGAAASALRTFLREHSKLPSAKICAVFRGVRAAGSIDPCNMELGIPQQTCPRTRRHRAVPVLHCRQIDQTPSSTNAVQASPRCTSPPGWVTRQLCRRCCRLAQTQSCHAWRCVGYPA